MIQVYQSFQMVFEVEVVFQRRGQGLGFVFLQGFIIGCGCYWGGVIILSKVVYFWLKIVFGEEFIR